MSNIEMLKPVKVFIIILFTSLTVFTNGCGDPEEERVIDLFNEIPHEFQSQETIMRYAGKSDMSFDKLVKLSFADTDDPLVKKFYTSTGTISALLYLQRTEKNILKKRGVLNNCTLYAFHGFEGEYEDYIMVTVIDASPTGLFSWVIVVRDENNNTVGYYCK